MRQGGGAASAAAREGHAFGLGILLRWLQLGLTWLLSPSDESRARSERDRKAKALREARRCIRG